MDNWNLFNDIYIVMSDMYSIPKLFHIFSTTEISTTCGLQSLKTKQNIKSQNQSEESAASFHTQAKIHVTSNYNINTQHACATDMFFLKQKQWQRRILYYTFLIHV